MNVTIAPDYLPHIRQALMHASSARFLAIAAGVRGGKTKSASVAFLDRIYQDLAAGKGRPVTGYGRRRSPRLRYWIVAPVMPLTRYPYEYVIQFAPPELIEATPQTDYSIWLRPDILIECKTAERPDLLVGADVDGMLITEACRIKADSWRGALRGRLTTTKGWALFESSPLGGRNNWIYQEIVSRASVRDGVQQAEGDPEYASFSWRTIDNPHIDPAEVEAARRQLPAAWFAREYEASWDSFGGAVYPEFNDDTHVISEQAFRLAWRLPNRVNDQDLRSMCTRVVAGVDFGYTSAGAIVVVGQLRDNAFVILEESYAPSRPVSGSAQTTWVSEARRLQQRWGVSLFACDPSRPDAINDMCVNSLPAAGANNDIHLGVRRVAEALHVDPVSKRPGMHILSRCKDVVREIRNYQWKSTKDQNGFAEVPAEGQSDHGLDGLRYAMAELRPYAEPKREYRPNVRPLS